MVLLRHIAIAAAACAVASLTALADDQKPPPGQQVYTPRLNNIMILTQLGHFKLWYAGAVQNWPLANYELEQIRASVRLAKTLFPDSDKSNMDTMKPAAEDLDKAINAKDAATVAAGPTATPPAWATAEARLRAMVASSSTIRILRPSRGRGCAGIKL